MFSCNFKYPDLDPNVKTCALSEDFLKQNPQWAEFISKYKIFNILSNERVPHLQPSGDPRGDSKVKTEMR